LHQKFQGVVELLQDVWEEAMEWECMICKSFMLKPIAHVSFFVFCLESMAMKYLWKWTPIPDNVLLGCL
jgi:hypothetical protein